MPEHISIILTHHASPAYADRSMIMRKSIRSLINTTKDLPCEIIVIDNGGSLEDSEFILKLVDSGEITTYIRNKDNMLWSYAWDQAYKISSGEYLVFTCNDILFQEGWLKECLKILKNHKGEKYFVTPYLDQSHFGRRFELPDIEDARVNNRSGSNCIIIDRETYEKVGRFSYHVVGGSLWYDRVIGKEGYRVLIPKRNYISDLGFKNGFVHKLVGGHTEWFKDVHMDKILTNGEHIHFEEEPEK